MFACDMVRQYRDEPQARERQASASAMRRCPPGPRSAPPSLPHLWKPSCRLVSPPCVAARRARNDTRSGSSAWTVSPPFTSATSWLQRAVLVAGLVHDRPDGGRQLRRRGGGV